MTWSIYVWMCVFDGMLCSFEGPSLSIWKSLKRERERVLDWRGALSLRVCWFEWNVKPIWNYGACMEKSLAIEPYLAKSIILIHIISIPYFSSKFKSLGKKTKWQKCLCGFIIPIKFAKYVFVVGISLLLQLTKFSYKLEIFMNEVRNFDLGEFKT